MDKYPPPCGFDIKRFFFVSNAPYWFVKTYMLLYIFSPIVNAWLDKTSLTSRYVAILLLGYCSWVAGVLRFDDSLLFGKNILNFVLLYVIGNTLHLYWQQIKRVPMIYLLLAYVVLNLICCSAYYWGDLGFIKYDMMFRYNGFFNILNTCLVFAIFMHWNIKSSLINSISASCFAIYLIHESEFMRELCIRPIVSLMQVNIHSPFVMLVALAVFGVIIMMLCIVIDKCLSPCWKLISKSADKFSNTKMGSTLNKYGTL